MTALAILTLNAGSSSLKFAAFALAKGAELPLLASGQIEGIGATAKGHVEAATGERSELAFDSAHGAVDHSAALGAILDWLKSAEGGASVAAVGHRIVHGGTRYAEPALIDEATLAALRELIPLAPLHQPHNIAGIEAAMRAFPSAPQVACFDTAFHRAHPFVADAFALPRSFYDEGVRRYGFHGLSYEFIVQRLRALAPAIAGGRAVVAHLGNGASMCAIRDGRSVASTMSFTALDGLAMGTRSGQLDPAVVLYLMSEKNMTAEEVSDLLWKESGLKGMSGLSQDMRELEASESQAAKDAVAYFVARARHELGGLAAALGGLDAIVFTAGIGEHAWRVREAIVADLEFMGVQLDREANRANARIISAAASPVAVYVIPTDEELVIAQHTARLAGAT
jgi:acetate kinase